MNQKITFTRLQSFVATDVQTYSPPRISKKELHNQPHSFDHSSTTRTMSSSSLDNPPFTPTTLPFNPLFNRLLRFAHSDPPRLCIRDLHTSHSATHLQLLNDVLSFRQKIWSELTPSTRRALHNREEVYIAILAPGGYEFAVAILAALALGAAVVPLTTALPAAEALYFVRKARAVAVLVSQGAVSLGVEIEKLVKNEDARGGFVCVPIRLATGRERLLRAGEITTDRRRALDDRAPGVVIFTSGTTGSFSSSWCLILCCG
jgi:malonyl-CoA/methylmalonyl-CoA synthetase